MAQKIITIILVLLVVGGLAWYLDKTYLRSSRSPSNKLGETVPEYKSSSSNTRARGNLLYLVSGNAKEIWQVDAKKATKRIFTDADETEKILKVSNLAPLTKEVMAITSPDKSSLVGKLVAINLASSKETVLAQSFILPSAWAVSSDGKKIAYSTFSNLEENYGYTLYSQARDGNNKREIANSSSEIKSPSWNEAGTKIVYVKTAGTKSEVEVSVLDTGRTETIKSFDEQLIDWVSWSADKLVISIRSLNNNREGTVKIMNADGRNLEKITDFRGGIANFVYLENNTWLGYLIGQYEDKIDESVMGQIYLKNIAENEEIPIQKGNQILGWLSEG